LLTHRQTDRQTDKQTNKVWQKHNFLDGGKNYRWVRYFGNNRQSYDSFMKYFKLEQINMKFDVKKTTSVKSGVPVQKLNGEIRPRGVYQ